jgi:hypothetical protein
VVASLCVFVRLCASLCVWERLGEAHCLVPLCEKVKFPAKLQRGNRLQVCKYVLWKYKLETNQTLQVTVSYLSMILHIVFFLARISKDEKIVIPKVNMNQLQDKIIDLADVVVNVTIEPF